MTLPHTPALTEPRLAGDKRPAWLLILTLPAFVAYLVFAVATIAGQVESSAAELTRAQLSDLGAAWVALHVLWVTPTALAAVALAWLARSWRLRNATGVRVLAGSALVLAAVYLGVQVLAFGFEGATLGDSPWYALGVAASLAAGWAGTLLATIVVAVELARRGIARRTAYAVAALTALYLVFEVLTYLPALLGSATLAETVGLPPFVLGFFWAALGGALLRGRVPSDA